MNPPYILASSLSGTEGILTIAALAVASVALLACAWLGLKLRRVRKAQRVVLGESQRDLVGHAAEMQDAFEMMQRYVSDTAERLDTRLAAVESDLQGKIAHHALVRYDAYNELSGRQSMSIAMLDETRSGIVLSCIHHRDQARLYGKQVREGLSELELSPEEADAIRIALATPPGGDDSRLTA